jgi:SPRY domain
VLTNVIASLEDRQQDLFNYYCKLHLAERENFAERLDFYQVEARVNTSIRASPCLAVVEGDTYFRVSKNIAVGKVGASTLDGLIWDSSVVKYSVVLESSMTDVYIGFAPSSQFNVTDVAKDSSCGWFLHIVHTNYGFSAVHVVKDCKHCPQFEKGDVFQCTYDSKSKQISFMKNGSFLCQPFPNISGDAIAPAVMMKNKTEIKFYKG